MEIAQPPQLQVPAEGRLYVPHDGVLRKVSGGAEGEDVGRLGLLHGAQRVRGRLASGKRSGQAIHRTKQGALLGVGHQEGQSAETRLGEQPTQALHADRQRRDDRGVVFVLWQPLDAVPGERAGSFRAPPALSIGGHGGALALTGRVGRLQQHDMQHMPVVARSGPACNGAACGCQDGFCRCVKVGQAPVHCEQSNAAGLRGYTLHVHTRRRRCCRDVGVVRAEGRRGVPIHEWTISEAARKAAPLVSGHCGSQVVVAVRRNEGLGSAWSGGGKGLQSATSSRHDWRSNTWQRHRLGRMHGAFARGGRSAGQCGNDCSRHPLVFAAVTSSAGGGEAPHGHGEVWHLLCRARCWLHVVHVQGRDGVRTVQPAHVHFHGMAPEGSGSGTKVHHEYVRHGLLLVDQGHQRVCGLGVARLLRTGLASTL